MALFVAKIRRTIVEIFEIPIAAETIDEARVYLREHGDHSAYPWYEQNGGLTWPDATESDTTAVIDITPITQATCPYDAEVLCYNKDDIDVTVAQALVEE